MRRAHFILAFCAMAGSVGLVRADECAGHCAACHQCARDDRGLLEWVDSFAGRLQQGIEKGTSNFGKAASSLTSWQPKQKRRTFSSASCGCESSCDCAACGSQGNTEILEVQGSAPPRVPIDNHLEWTPVQPKAQPAVPYDQSVPPSLEVPSPQTVPDAQTNPFMDEPGSSHRVRGHTIQYRQPGSPLKQPTPRPPKYGQQYNSQAAHTSESHPQRPGQLVRTASSSNPSLEDTFKLAYRVQLTDTAESRSAEQPEVGHTGLRPVPEGNSSRRSAKTIPSDDAYEHEEPAQLHALPNPLRR